MSTPEPKKQKNFWLTASACQILAGLKAKTGRSENQLVEELIQKANELLTPHGDRIAAVLEAMNEKLDDLLKRQ